METRPALHIAVRCAAVLACCGATVVHAQGSDRSDGAATVAPDTFTFPTPSPSWRPDEQDMAMPTDLGEPLDPGPSAPPSVVGSKTLSVNSPIAQIASSPKGREVLDHDLPGLCERPEYAMFKTLSLTRLAGMSDGRITEAKLGVVQADLVRLGPGAAAPLHGAFYPLTHTATSSLQYGGRQIGRFSRSLYRHVVLVVASL